MKSVLIFSIVSLCIFSSCQNKTDKEDANVETIKSDNDSKSASLPVDTLATVAENDKTYNFITMKNPPSYPGGIAEFYEFLGKNINYPEQAINNNVQGNVFLSFTVSASGNIEDIKVDKKLGSGTDEEAIRVLKLSKKWNPGMENGKPVRAKYNIPIKFSLPK